MASRNEYADFADRFDSRRRAEENACFVGYTCSYVPPEVIYAAGFLPERIVGRSDLCAHVDSSLSCNLCPYVHGIMKTLRESDNGSASDQRYAGVVLVDSCDAMRKLYDALRLEMYDSGGLPVYLLSVPRKSDEGAARFFALQLENMIGFVSEHATGALPKSRPLREAMELYAEIRGRLSEIRKLLAEQNLSAYLALKHAALDGDPLENLSILEGLKEEITAQPPMRLAAASRPEVAVSGSPVPGTEILAAIEEAGFKIILNDSCLDERGLIDGKAEGLTPLSLARSYLEKIPCARMLGRDTFLQNLAARARDRGAAGLIQLRMPFCDLYGFDHVRFMRSFSREKVLQIETDGSKSGLGQAKTRINAFYEMLSASSGPSRRRMTAMEGQIYCGLDVGSTTVDGVLLDSKGRILAWAIERTGPGPESSARALMDQMLAESGDRVAKPAFIMATGYGRDGIRFADGTVTEISCHARGIRHLLDGIRLVIDIGGQDCKVIGIDERGEVKGFQMNDKCAAGTGRFLEVMAGALGVSLEEMGSFGMVEGRRVSISSVCTVFAESEVVSMIGRGIEAPAIARGLYQSIINRIEAMVRRVGLQSPVAVTGGGALNRGLVFGLEKRLSTAVSVPDNPQIVGALGASLFAMAERGVVLESSG
jgi:predicted CoA-substrate-specific enzyme activase